MTLDWVLADHRGVSQMRAEVYLKRTTPQTQFLMLLLLNARVSPLTNPPPSLFRFVHPACRVHNNNARLKLCTDPVIHRITSALQVATLLRTSPKPHLFNAAKHPDLFFYRQTRLGRPLGKLTPSPIVDSVT